MQTLRYSSADVAARYPMAISDAVVWSSSTGGWSTTIPLPDLANDHIVVPSIAVSGTPAVDCVIALATEDSHWTLCPTAQIDCSPRSNGAGATTHIDYFHCRTELRAPTVILTVATPQPPQRYLLTVASREFRRSPEPGRASTRRLVVPAISQLTAPSMLRHRICSPTCITMVLNYHGIDASLAAVSSACFHAPSKLYGVWPLAIRAAADAGVIAAVECFTDLDAVAPILERGLPIVASIRFAAGELPGSPLASTDGHLVVVTGIDRDTVYVNDPAPRDASTVPRQYPRAAFAAAWLAQRGVAYVVAPLR